MASGDTGRQRDGDPWHDGEREVHRRLGLAELIDPIGRRNIRNFMPDQHRVFFAQLPFAVLGAVDRTGDPWATILAGPPGFLSSPDPKLLCVGAYPPEGDPAANGIYAGSRVALLGIELPTRRRNRANGRVAALGLSGFAVAIEQSFGNCPQYIQRRSYEAPWPARFPDAAPIPRDDGWALDLIRRADTAFVASATAQGDGGPGAGVDVSHRGGRPGFIAIAEDGVLEIPDYRGNRYFNTLGNLLAYPRAGLAIPDFDTGELLQITGTTEIVWGRPKAVALGVDRLWRLKPARMFRSHDVFPLRLGQPEFSPALANPEPQP